MSVFTSFLKLFKYDLEKDKNSTFNITLSMNNNWDKIDAYAKEQKAKENEIIASIPKRLSKLTNDMNFITAANVALNSLYTSIYTDNTNFIIEFFSDTEKTNRVFMIQLGQAKGFTTVTFKKSFNVIYGVFGQVLTGESCVSAAISSVKTTSFYINDGTHGGKHEDRGGLTNYWVAFGT